MRVRSNKAWQVNYNISRPTGPSTDRAPSWSRAGGCQVVVADCKLSRYFRWQRINCRLSSRSSLILLAVFMRAIKSSFWAWPKA